MTASKAREIRWKYIDGEYVSTLALIRAGILVEDEETKALTEEYNNPKNTKDERMGIRRKIDAAGYVVGSYGRMKGMKVFKEVL